MSSINRKRTLKQIIKYYLFKGIIYKRFNNRYRIPECLYIECTNICNAKCVFCCYPLLANEIDRTVMPVEEFKRIINEYVDMGGRNLALTPTMADPLTDPLLHERLKIVESSEINTVSFYTNLISFKKNLRDVLGELSEGIKVRIRVSIVGFDRKSYCKYMGVDQFDRVRENLIKLAGISEKAAALDVLVILRDYQGSEESKKELCSWLEQLGLKWSLEVSFDTWGGNLEEQLKSLGDLPVKDRLERVGPCRVSYEKPLITVNGDMKLCDCRDAYDELVVGNVFSSNIRSIWRGRDIERMRNSFFSDEIPSVCSKCEFYRSIY